MGARSDFLFAQPSALSGVARLLDLGGSFDAYNESRTPGQADAWALLNDWCVVGLDLSESFEQVLREYLESEAGGVLLKRLENMYAAL